MISSGSSGGSVCARNDFSGAEIFLDDCVRGKRGTPPAATSAFAGTSGSFPGCLGAGDWSQIATSAPAKTQNRIGVLKFVFMNKPCWLIIQNSSAAFMDIHR